ncbi:MAG TPA: DUF4382 domain-containing protein [Bacteroidales bacterium]|jgi:hypothetical protein|nr:DUF4382 domain-containing protein [Bacteroidales bacterium]MZQ79664.1 DUF4382 domain-containing protein [Bacteroidales bacterium]HNV65736.1 DUF4382 domain-containing protein [Bacteroidales bacterium]HNY57561.1 DUF4382 domain-containing protein [Bacteroidales bacterium]HOE25193.1 DUF4382 domain-containing protein [Bacteroidales bacterium]
MMKKNAILLLAAALILISGACNEIRNGDGTGRVILKVTDAPFDINSIESALVTITKVELREECDGISDACEFITLSEDTVTLDLIDLRNGVTETLLDMEIPAGRYDMVRLYIYEAGLKLKDSELIHRLKVPGGSQSGIKVFLRPVLEVAEGSLEEILLDIDLSRSFILRGNPAHNNGFIFKPVVRAANMAKAGCIRGVVTDTEGTEISGASVWIEQDTVTATTFTDTRGFYAIIGVPTGIWSVSATKEGYDTVRYDGINVIAGNKTVQNFVLTKK